MEIPKELQADASQDNLKDLQKGLHNLPPRKQMSGRQRGAPGGRARANQENGEEQSMWNEIKERLAELNRLGQEANELTAQIFAGEEERKAIKATGSDLSPAQLQSLELLYRKQLKNGDDSKALLDSGLFEKVEILKAMVKSTEDKAELAAPRGTSSRDRDSQSRSVMDLDGPSDSPAPPSAAERLARKHGAGRTGSQPPSRGNIEVQIRSEAPPGSVERNAGRPKITYDVNDEVAFKRKTDNDLDWVQGVVTRVIGEGKSRRYEVKDPYPDAPVLDNSNSNVYKSSASQMVPIPTPGTKFEDYEKGKRVLALYPDTSTFYRAEVLEMLENGTVVKVLFEEENAGKDVERRMVLNHTG